MNLLLRVLFIVQDFDRVRFEVDVKRIFSHSHPLLAICRLLCSLCVCMCVCLRALSLSSARAYVCVCARAVCTGFLPQLQGFAVLQGELSS